MGERIDFNCDMGESFGMYKMGFDEEVIKYITSANIACGFHAGDPMWMRKTVALAEEQGVAVGAHPSYPDLNGFGEVVRQGSSAAPQTRLPYLAVDRDFPTKPERKVLPPKRTNATDVPTTRVSSRSPQ